MSRDSDAATVADAAERAVLCAVMWGGAPALADLRDQLAGRMFRMPHHEDMWNAITDLADVGAPVAPASVLARLLDAGKLRGLMTGDYLARVAGLGTPPYEAGRYADIVRSQAERRDIRALAGQLIQAADESEDADLDEVMAKLATKLAEITAQGGGAAHPTLSKLLVPGGTFVLDVPETPPAVWGRDGDVLWAEGEALMIAGPQGAGKTTLAFQVIRARLGLQGEVLGLPVVPGGGRVLYLAMDRPAQAQRAAARLFAKDDRAILDQRLIVWKGPPPMDFAKNSDVLTTMCREAGADTVVLDSLKDAAVGLSDDLVGASYNRARQVAIASGVQVLELHHPRKAGANGGEPTTIADIYGSTWLTSGCGSVISLYGAAGDPIVSFRHLKQPMNEVGPFKVAHDHAAGISAVMHGVDLLELVRISGAEGLIARAAAVALFETVKPTDAQVEKARRRMEKLRADGILYRLDGSSKAVPAAYYLAARGSS